MIINEIYQEAETQLRLAEASNTCIVVSIELPLSCSPNTCRLGFEKLGDISKILVDKGIQYSGPNETFRVFLSDGEMSFNDNTALREFLEQVKLVAEEVLLSEHIVPEEIEIVNHLPVNPHEIADTDNIVRRNMRPLRFDSESFLADIQGEIIGQKPALTSLTNAINTHVRKRKSERPLSILLAGKSGVGKTKTAEELSDLLRKHTGNRWGYIRVDMNQLNAEHTVSRLIGAPPGYIGYGDPPLFKPLLQNKYQVILFDEMEKAHPKVMQMLMNAMANGRLEASFPMQTDTISFDFCQCIFIFTTNFPLSVEGNLSQTEVTQRCREQLCRSQINGTPMLQEIANRFTSIIIYRMLGEMEKVDILVLTIVRLGRQYWLEVKRISDELLQHLCDLMELNNGVRDLEYELEAYLGVAFANFSDLNAGTSIKLSGTLEDIQISLFNMSA